ncbi:unnamed protein product [Dovyalis caffra]|uniref:Uncharacterized protein n=1 Tax=Dovyalis caffra TaxID=77055 RepID=A0AAV1RXA6_9ROSI|nr:unnamed protein product [Dovyalis caffra]
MENQRSQSSLPTGEADNPNPNQSSTNRSTKKMKGHEKESSANEKVDVTMRGQKQSYKDFMVHGQLSEQAVAYEWAIRYYVVVRVAIDIDLDKPILGSIQVEDVE